VCVVELEGARVLAPACQRRVEAGMRIKTDSERVRHSRKARARVPGVLGRRLDGADAPGISPAVRRTSGALRGRAHRGRPAQARQRGLRPRLREVHPLLQVRPGLRVRVAEHVRDRRRRAAGSARGSRRSTKRRSRLGLRLLRQLHRGVPDRRARRDGPSSTSVRAARWNEDAQTRTDTVCPYCGVGCVPHAPRPGQPHRQGHLAVRPRRDARATSASRAASAGRTSTRTGEEAPSPADDPSGKSRSADASSGAA
jgi:hypothetical protein